MRRYEARMVREDGKRNFVTRRGRRVRLCCSARAAAGRRRRCAVSRAYRPHSGRHPHRRDDITTASAEPRHRDGVPGLRAVPAHDRRGEHRLRLKVEGLTGRRGGSASKTSQRRWTSANCLTARPTNSRRPTPAGRHRPGDRPTPERVPDGRTAGEPRREAQIDMRDEFRELQRELGTRPSTSPTIKRRR